jgi:hypothetical protein
MLTTGPVVLSWQECMKVSICHLAYCCCFSPFI